MTDDLIKRLWESDAASALTNEAARCIEAAQAENAALRARAEEAELDGKSAWALLRVSNDNTASVVVERDTLRAKLARAEAAVGGSREALECARAIMDTPIARRRLNLDPSDERLAVFRAALAEHERTKG